MFCRKIILFLLLFAAPSQQKVYGFDDGFSFRSDRSVLVVLKSSQFANTASSKLVCREGISRRRSRETSNNVSEVSSSAESNSDDSPKPVNQQYCRSFHRAMPSLSRMDISLNSVTSSANTDAALLGQQQFVGESRLVLSHEKPVADDYADTLEQQEHELISVFCSLIDYKAGPVGLEQLVQYKKQQKGPIGFIDLEGSDSFWQRFLQFHKLDDIFIKVEEQPHPCHPDMKTGIAGNVCYLYPAFNNLSPTEQLAKMYQCIESLKCDHDYRYSVMNVLLQNIPLNNELKNKAEDALDDYRSFSVRRAQLQAILLLKLKQESDLLSLMVSEPWALSWKEAVACYRQFLQSCNPGDIPVDYIDELSSYLIQEEIIKKSQTTQWWVDSVQNSNNVDTALCGEVSWNTSCLDEDIAMYDDLKNFR